MKRPPEHTGLRVRWQQGRSSSWHYGYLGELEGDGSVRVWDAYNGSARSLPTSVLQCETEGPRGGKRWEWIEPRPAPKVTAVCTVQWNPPEGPAELFNQQPLFSLGREAGS